MATLTSITVDKFNNWKTNAPDRAELRCKKIPGFFAIKLKRGASWRLRYTDLMGKRKTATIAEGSVKPLGAAQIALEWREKLSRGIDPAAEKAAEKAAQAAIEEREAARQYLNTGRYFEAIYTPLQVSYHRSGRETLSIIRRNFEHLFSRRMDTLNQADLAAWYHRRRDQGVSRATLQRAYGALKTMLTAATKRHDYNAPPVLEHNPLRDVSLPWPTLAERDETEAATEHNSKKRGVIPEDTMQALFDGLERFAEEKRAERRRSRQHSKGSDLPDLDVVEYPHWFIPFCWIAIHTGMRPGDVRLLRWENLRHNPFAKAGESKDTLVFTPSKTKSKGDPVKVNFPVTGHLLDVLTHWREQQGTPQSGYVFPSERTGGPFDRKAYQKPWQRVKVLGGVTERLDFYGLRHNFVSRAVMAGSLTTVAQLVGHADTGMIAKHYAHLIPSEAARVVAQFSESVTPKQPEQEGDNKERTA